MGSERRQRVMSRVFTIVVLALLLANVASAQTGQNSPPQSPPPPEVLLARALVLQARGEAGAEDVMAQACEAGSARACLHAASRALDADDLEMAEEYLHLAHEADPEDEGIRLYLARFMASQGNFMWAVRELQALEQAGHDVAFELGYCLYELELDERAVESLEASAQSDSQQAPIAALYAAAAHERLGQFEEARLMAERAGEFESQPDVDEAARVMRRELRRRSSSDRVLFAGYATLAGGYDSNPVLGPDEAPIGEGGGRLWLRARVFGEPLGGSFWALGGRIAISRDQSFDPVSRPFDYTSLQASAHARFTYRAGIPNELRLGYRFGIGWLDGGQGVEEDDIYAYSESHLGELTYSFAATDRLTTRIRASTGWTVYHNMARTGVPLTAGLGQSATFLDGHLKIYGEIGARAAWTRSPQYDRAGFSLSFALSYLTPLWDLELVTAWSYQWSRYNNSTGVQFSFDYTQPELHRRDSVNALTLEIGRNFLDDHLRVAVRYRLTHAVSTIVTYDYTRHTIELALTGGGGL